MRTERIEIRITKREKSRIRRFASKHGISVTELIERGIDTYISQRDKDGNFLKQ